MTAFSPLRYPGGKQALSNVLARLIEDNGLEGGIYAEAYAGWAGAALTLLYREYVSKLLLNDADSGIFAFWTSMLCHTDELCKRIRDVALSTKEWRKQKAIYSDQANHSVVDVGFATFYLNRTNRSGIIKNGGPIGGYDQSGTWKIDARFNRLGLVDRIERIALYRARITFTHSDARAFLRGLPSDSKLIAYLDPPYYRKGRELYLNHYTEADHAALAQFLKEQRKLRWVLTYDRVSQVEKLYKGFRRVPFTLSYSATGRSAGREVLILSDGLHLPKTWLRRLPKKAITVSRTKAA